MKSEKVLFGAGCFWGVQASFNLIKNLSNVQVGYSGGNSINANYQDVCSGNSGHIEVVQVTFIPEVTPFSLLLDLFFFIHDPTQLNKQGNDVGHQYKSAIFYNNLDQKRLSEKKILELEKNIQKDQQIQTELFQLKNFFTAEEYHQNYLDKNPLGYCHINIQQVKDFLKSAPYFRNS